MSIAKLNRLACARSFVGIRRPHVVQILGLGILLNGLSLIAPPQAAAADSYLDMLRNEAKSGGAEVDKIGNRKAKARDSISLGNTSIKSQQDLEAKLDRDHPSTYTLYKKLNTKQKQEVYSTYQINGSFDQVTRKVLKLLYGI